MKKLEIINVMFDPEQGVIIDGVCSECGLESVFPLSRTVKCELECGGTEFSYDNNEFDFSYEYDLLGEYQVRLEEANL